MFHLTLFRLLLPGLMLGLTLPLGAQQACTGNLGANIFEQGDFGFGTANVLPVDPGIAPGYTYTFLVPPEDGFYTITTNMALWNWLYPTWIPAQDNSGEVNGYMMVVNASFSPGIFYEQTVDGLCENTLYEFSADILNLIRSGIGGHIRPNVSFLLNGQEEYITGEIPQNNGWNNYGFTFATQPGETSVTLTLRNNAPGGVGNDLALDNISFRACGPAALILPQEVANICEDGNPISLNATIEGEQYDTPALQWQQSFDEGDTWVDIPGASGLSIQHTSLSAGYYYYRYLLANSPGNLANAKCRVISNIKVVFVQPKFYEVEDTICAGNEYLFGDTALTVAGTYVDSLRSSLGCDSIVTLRLEVVPDLGIAAEISIVSPACPGDSNGQAEVLAVENVYPPAALTLEGIEETTGSQAVFAGLSAGTYTLNITGRFGCRATYMLELEDPAPFRIELGPDRPLTLGEELRLPVLANYPLAGISWQPAPAVICQPDCRQPQVQPVESTWFSATATSAAGCIATDSVFVAVEEARLLYLPNAFSPNGDGRNDRFTVYASVPNVQEIISLQVYGRWGALLFEQNNCLPNDPAAGWDGTCKGEKVPAGAYTYACRARFIDGQERGYTGTVHLLR